MSYQTFSSLQFRLLPKSSFQSIDVDWRETSGENITLTICRYNSFFFDV